MNLTQFTPCPRCAATITQAHLVNQGMGGFTYVIRCPCGLSFDTGALSEEAAADKWNERPDDAVVFRDLMERADDICEQFELEGLHQQIGYKQFKRLMAELARIKGPKPC